MVLRACGGMVDAAVLETVVERRGGSSPLRPINELEITLEVTNLRLQVFGHLLAMKFSDIEIRAKHKSDLGGTTYQQACAILDYVESKGGPQKEWEMLVVQPLYQRMIRDARVGALRTEYNIPYVTSEQSTEFVQRTLRLTQDLMTNRDRYDSINPDPEIDHICLAYCVFMNQHQDLDEITKTSFLMQFVVQDQYGYNNRYEWMTRQGLRQYAQKGIGGLLCTEEEFCEFYNAKMRAARLAKIKAEEK